MVCNFGLVQERRRNYVGVCEREITEILSQVHGRSWRGAACGEVRLGKRVGDAAIREEEATHKFALRGHFVIGVGHELVLGEWEGLAEGSGPLRVKRQAGVNGLRRWD